MNKKAIKSLARKRVSEEPYNWTGLTAKQLVDAGRLAADKAAEELSNGLSEQDFAALGCPDMDCATISAIYVNFKDACMAQLN